MVEQADYTIKANPMGKKSWREADNIEVVLELKLPNEIKVFRGITTLTGIKKLGTVI